MIGGTRDQFQAISQAITEIKKRCLYIVFTTAGMQSKDREEFDNTKILTKLVDNEDGYSDIIIITPHDVIK